MDRNPSLKPARRAGDRPQVLLRLYVSGRSEYTQAVLENVDNITRRYDPDEVIVQTARDLDHRTVVVGDLRQPDVITTLLNGHGIVARQ